MKMGFVWALILLALPANAAAQAYQCRLPAAPNVPEVRQDAPSRVMPVTGYTMALSWSPSFCRGKETQRSHAAQCSGRNGRFGLVVHGFWPDGGRSWPQYCPAPARLTPTEARKNMCMIPSARLMARQWVKHGSCMTKRPETYFEVTRILWNSYRIPDYDRLSRKDGLTAGDIRKAFADANGGWEPAHIGVRLSNNGWLRELRLCYSKRFRPTRCDDRHYGADDNTPAKIWRGL